MEVHHHTHSSTGSGHRKRWPHYFWEFLMLFLAVFCGFLAENKREQIVENHRAKDYAKILIADLKKDTTELQSNLSDIEKIRGYIDSVHSISIRFKGKDSVPATFYYYSRQATTTISTTWNNSTLRQLINSGNARYFRNQKLLALLSEYDMRAAHISMQQENDRHFRNTAMESRSRILDAEFFGAIAGVKMENVNVKMPGKPNTLFFPVYNNDAMMNEFLNSLHNRKATLSYLTERNLPKNLYTARELIEILKAEYSVE